MFYEIIIRSGFFLTLCQLYRTTDAQPFMEEPGKPFWPKRLVRDMTERLDYDARVRPVADYSLPINVTLRMNLYQIVDVNERNQHVALYMWVEQKWKDEFLAWDPKKYGNLESIVIPYEKVWLPDTYLYNSLEMVRENTERWISIVLTMEENQTSATVAFRYPAIYRYTCNMDILYFPFDKQRCTMFFGSWMYDAAGIDYFPLTEHVIMTDYIPSEEWTVLAFTCRRQLNRYKCCPVPFAVLICDLILHRKPLHYLVNLVVPTLIITLISFVGFFSPASTNGERTEKVNLGITTLLAMSILLLMVSDQMPTTSNFVPLIGWFYLSVILLISIATITTAIIIMIQKKGYYGHAVPKVMRKIFFYYIAWLVRMKMPTGLGGYNRKWSLCNDKPYEPELNTPLANTIEILPPSERSQYDNNVLNDHDYNLNSQHNRTTVRLLKSPKSETVVDYDTYRGVDENLVVQLKHIQRQLVQLNDYVRSKEESEIVQLEWEWLAALLDRCLLILFTFIALSVSFIICFLDLTPWWTINKTLRDPVMLPFILLQLFLNVGITVCTMPEITKDHVRLIRDILDFSGYDRRVRPVVYHTQTVNVTVQIHLYQILEVNEPGQFLQLYIWMAQSWRDEFIFWEPDNYDRISTAIIPHEQVWLPDTYLFNSLEMVREHSERWTGIVAKTEPLQERSQMSFRYPALYKFTCHMNIFYFPFDRQTCNLTFGSWTYDATGIDYFPIRNDVYMEEYIQNQEWSIVEFKMFRELEYYKCCANPFAVLQARLIIQRKPLFYIINLIIPAFIITFVAFVGFFSPDSSSGERKEKVNLGIGTLLAMSVLLMTLSNQMPTTSKYLPLMGFFYLYIIVFISLATLITCLVIKLENQGHYGRKVPNVMKKIFFDYISVCFFMRLPKTLEEQTLSSSVSNEFNNVNNRNNEPKLTNLTDNNENQPMLSTISRHFEKFGNQLDDCFKGMALDNKQQEIVSLEWHWLAEILERILLTLFLLSLLIMTCCLFMVAVTGVYD